MFHSHVPATSWAMALDGPGAAPRPSGACKLAALQDLARAAASEASRRIMRRQNSWKAGAWAKELQGLSRGRPPAKSGARKPWRGKGLTPSRGPASSKPSHGKPGSSRAHESLQGAKDPNRPRPCIFVCGRASENYMAPKGCGCPAVLGVFFPWIV